ncbi:MAG: hypothetical protein Q8K68_03925 [Nitrospirota bacterium]|nr:hypothetical protein [Nitrospirota bacterium]
MLYSFFDGRSYPVFFSYRSMKKNSYPATMNSAVRTPQWLMPSTPGIVASPMAKD